jgi:hypothetical protein
LKRKKYDVVPTMNEEEFKPRNLQQIEKTSEVFPRWVPPPEVSGGTYSSFFEPRRATEFSVAGVPSHQMELSMARIMCNNNMSRPINQTKLHSILSKIKDEDCKKAFGVWWHSSGHHIDKEVILTYGTIDLYIRFKPSPTGKAQRKDGLLHGAYEAFVVTHDGGQLAAEVAPDWVQENVSSDAVEILHQVSKDWNEKHTDSDARMENGFLTLQGMDKKKKDGKEIQMEYNYMTTGKLAKYDMSQEKS